MSSAIVVGSGVFGASLARQLAVREWDVTMVEQYSPAHSRASSGGDTRLIRLAHGGDELLTSWVRDGLDIWKQLDELSDDKFVVPCGLVWLVRGEGTWESASQRELAKVGIQTERRSVEDLADLLPGAVSDGLSWLLLEPEAVVLKARAAVKAIVRDAERHGVTAINGQAQRVQGGVQVDGVLHSADCVIWACGPWLGSLFPEHVPIRVTRQDELFFGGPAGGQWKSPPMPGWIDFDRGAYGHGDIDGIGIKCGADVEGVEVDPDAVERLPEVERVEHARSVMGERFPALADAPIIGSKTCQYSLTPDSNFVAGDLPGSDGREWVMGGGSGHGFKHGPALANYMVDLIEGRTTPLGRFALGPRQAVFGGDVRTAGTRERPVGNGSQREDRGS